MDSRFVRSKAPSFINQEEIELQLKEIQQDTAYNTQSTYSANSNLYPDNKMSFVAKHMAYLKAHSSLDPEQYIANLRLMTKIR